MSLCYTVQTNNNINYVIFTVFALQVNRRASVTPHITFLVVIQLYWYHETSDTLDLKAELLFRGRSFSHSKLGKFFILVFSSPAFSSSAFSTPALSASPQHSTLHLYEPPEIRQ